MLPRNAVALFSTIAVLNVINVEPLTWCIIVKFYYTWHPGCWLEKFSATAYGVFLKYLWSKNEPIITSSINILHSADHRNRNGLFRDGWKPRREAFGIRETFLDHRDIIVRPIETKGTCNEQLRWSELPEAGSYSATLPVVLSFDVDPLVDKMTLAGIQIGRALSYLISWRCTIHYFLRNNAHSVLVPASRNRYIVDR